MSKRTAIIIVIAVLVLGTLILYFLLGGKAPSGLPIFNGLPFGTPPDGEVGVPEPTEPVPNEGLDSEGRPLSRFIRVSDVPVAGAIGFLKNGSTYVRYVERATGHVVDMNPLTLEKTKILNTTRPRTYEAIFKQDASGYIARALDEGGDSVANTAISIIAPTGTSTTYSTQLSLLRGEMDDIGILPNGSLLYALSDTGQMTLSAFGGDRPRTLFTMPFSDWRIRTMTNDSALIFPKAGGSALGYLYTLNLSSGAMNKVAGPLSALIALPNANGSKIALSYISRDNILSVLTPSNGSIGAINPATLADKCVWSRRDTDLLICAVPEGGLGTGMPDNWYNGTASFVDRIWKFDTEINASELLLEPKKNYDLEIDAYELTLSPDEDWLFFTNKKDLTLWGLKLTP
jgi:hypothetical protein